MVETEAAAENNNEIEEEDVLDETLTVTIVEGGGGDEMDGYGHDGQMEVEEEEEDGQEENQPEEEEDEEEVEIGYSRINRRDDDDVKSASPSASGTSNATENVLYQEIPVRTNRPQQQSPPQCVDDYAEPQLMITSPQPSTHSSITSFNSAAIPISTNGSPLYAQVHKEPRTEIQKIHSTIPNTFKNDNLGCMLTTFGTKTPSMTSFGNNSTPMSSLGASGSGSGAGGGSHSGWNKQMLAASYSNDLNSSKDSMLGSLDMLSDSGNHSDSWMYPQESRGGGAGGGHGGHRKKGGRAPPSSFTDQLNQVLADRERCVG